MSKRYLFQTNKIGPIKLENFKKLKLSNGSNSNNFTKEEICYLVDYIKQNYPATLYICELIDFYINEDEEIEREMYYLCLIRKNKYKNFLTDNKHLIDSAYTENEEIFIIHPDDNEVEKYIENRTKQEKLSKQLNIKLCNMSGKSYNLNTHVDTYDSKIIEKFEKKNKKSKFKIFKPNLNTINNLKKFSNLKKNFYKPPISEPKKNYTLIIKGIPTDIFYRQVETKLFHELSHFKQFISNVKVVKSADNNNKGIAFVDVNNETAFNKILDSRIIINNMILSTERKI